ncbi:hypothetical protein [Amycolatopsis sp.]|uniref:hypothetical protein n=1 Tax=Amycolatopsis sp. TaxID=37632 RepID=UPI002CCE0F43|nr:hypothetical protein [Amycolatopsis sp.]HVV12082.1 hypothetical protein [Amycolatopsis sp.]
MCFADSCHQPGGYAITVEQCARMLDVFVESEVEVVMFSGGELTIHKSILDFIDLAQARPMRNVNLNLNTDGIRLATDKRFVAPWPSATAATASRSTSTWVRRVRRTHAPRDPGQGPARAQAVGAGQLRRGRPDGDLGGGGGAGAERARAG